MGESAASVYDQTVSPTSEGSQISWERVRPVFKIRQYPQQVRVARFDGRECGQCLISGSIPNK